MEVGTQQNHGKEDYRETYIHDSKECIREYDEVMNLINIGSIWIHPLRVYLSTCICMYVFTI